MAAILSTSAIMATQGDTTALALALESLRGQTNGEFEVVLVDTSSEELKIKAVAALADSLESRLPVTRLSAPGATLGAAYELGVRGADGDRVILLRETGVVSRQFLAAHQRAEADEVVLSPRRALLARWRPGLPGATAPRMRSLLTRRPDLAAVVATAEPTQLLEPSDVRERFERTVPALSFNDYLWERFQPLVDRYTASLAGCPLPWLAGLGGYFSAPRRALYQAGLFEDAGFDYQIDDPEPCLALYRAQMRFRVAEDAIVYHQAAPLAGWPFCAFPMLDRLAERWDPVTTWMLLRYLGDGDVLTLAELAASSSQSDAPHTCEAFASTVAELLPLLLSDLRVWWSEFT
jgi:hypothetical protein